MTLKPVSVEEITCISTRRAHYKVIKSIEQFMDSPAQAVELSWAPGEYKSAASVQSSYYKAIRRLRARCIVISRDRKVYLIKEDVLDDN